ncbi:hypothetical protein U1Q18_007363 [Sarracenia purpurea var. burkii]
MAMEKSQASLTRDLKQRVLTCLNKLSDRDTHSAAAAELESIALTLTHDSIPPFISSIAATDSSDKSPVRKQCVRLISLLSETHGNALSPYLSKLLSAVVRRLRDSDSVVRSACVNAIASISSHVTKPPFTSIIKPLIEALVTEQDHNSQIGAALCLAAAIDASPDPEPLYLKKLLPRLEKLLKCNTFKAKPAVLTVIGSAIGAGAASTHQTLKNLLPCLVEFIGSEDWAARKSAAEALVKLAVMERDMLAEHKSACLKTFEAKKFDKVKIVRETMNQLIEAWKEIADVSDEVSPPPEPQSFSEEDASDGRYPPGSKTSCCAPQMRKKSIEASGNRSTLSGRSVATNARKRSPVDTSDRNSGAAMFRKLDRKRPVDRKIEIFAPPGPPPTIAVCEDSPWSRDEKDFNTDEKSRSNLMNPESRRALFNKDVDDNKMLKSCGTNSGSRVVPCQDDSSESTIAVSNVTEDIHKNQKESEDLSLIRKQLVLLENQQTNLQKNQKESEDLSFIRKQLVVIENQQCNLQKNQKESEDLSFIRKQLLHVENQQSSLLDLMQKFIGNSQNGMNSLETRVQGLEMALDQISYDVAVTTRMMSNIDDEATTCCKFPGAGFLSPKFWRRTVPRLSKLQFSSSRGTPPMVAIRNIANRNANSETFSLENRRFRAQNNGGFIVNPLAEIRSDSNIQDVIRGH